MLSKKLAKVQNFCQIKTMMGKKKKPREELLFPRVFCGGAFMLV